MNKKLKVATNQCGGCGFDLVFNPEKCCLICPSCNKEKEIVSEFGLNKHDLNDESKISHANQEWKNQMKTMQCPNCGANSVLQNFKTSASCPYCNTSLIASEENFDGLKPDAIIPFAFGKQKAAQLFKEKMKNKMFIPKNFKASINEGDINSYYFPTFVFDADCETIYDGRLYKDIKVKSSNNENGFSEVKRKYFKINGFKHTRHKDIEVEASDHLTQYELNIIKPYNFGKARTYSNDFVQGSILENYSTSVKDAYKTAKNEINHTIKKDILWEHSHDGVDYLNLNTKFISEKYSYCVLPLYRINYSYKNKNYSNIMNGQTGSLGGSYPKSGLKIVMFIMLLSLVVLLPVILFLIIAL